MVAFWWNVPRFGRCHHCSWQRLGRFGVQGPTADMKQNNGFAIRFKRQLKMFKCTKRISTNFNHNAQFKRCSKLILMSKTDGFARGLAKSSANEPLVCRRGLCGLGLGLHGSLGFSIGTVGTGQSAIPRPPGPSQGPAKAP